MGGTNIFMDVDQIARDAKSTEKKSVDTILEENIEKNQKEARTIYDNIITHTKELSQVDVATVKKLVTAADRIEFPAKYVASSVGQTKYIATFESEEDAVAAANTGILTGAKTLIENIYPAEDTIVIIERR
jgi:hypothetical protein